MNLHILSRFNQFFGIGQTQIKPTTTSLLTAEEKKALERKTVARFSRGNVRLQQGKYLTQEDIDAGLKRIRERAILNKD